MKFDYFSKFSCIVVYNSLIPESETVNRILIFLKTSNSWVVDQNKGWEDKIGRCCLWMDERCLIDNRYTDWFYYIDTIIYEVDAIMKAA